MVVLAAQLAPDEPDSEAELVTLAEPEPAADPEAESVADAELDAEPDSEPEPEPPTMTPPEPPEPPVAEAVELSEPEAEPELEPELEPEPPQNSLARLCALVRSVALHWLARQSPAEDCSWATLIGLQRHLLSESSQPVWGTALMMQPTWFDVSETCHHVQSPLNA